MKRRIEAITLFFLHCPFCFFPCELGSTGNNIMETRRVECGLRKVMRAARLWALGQVEGAGAAEVKCPPLELQWKNLYGGRRLTFENESPINKTKPGLGVSKTPFHLLKLPHVCTGSNQNGIRTGTVPSWKFATGSA